MTGATSRSPVVQHRAGLTRTLSHQESPALGLIDIWYEILSINR